MNIRKEIKRYFPVSSQTSDADKLILLKIIKFVKKIKKNFNYIEIGSFLGGSLTPFLMETSCKSIVSIDKRNQKQDDERNEEWSYENINEKDMINGLKKHGLNTSKLKTFNGDIKNFKTKKKFDLSFIDGIHTDINTFSDFLNVLNLSTRDSIVLFHDSSIIFKSIGMINLLLLNQNYRFKLVKFKNSEISGIFFEKYSHFNLDKLISPTEKFDRFCITAGENLLLKQINNRLKIDFKFSRFIKNKNPYKISLKKKEKKEIIL
tara:strand:+ start:281 stop:1069 length:789 start_codon:yes stop_codon:yes gene_type:complete